MWKFLILLFFMLFRRNNYPSLGPFLVQRGDLRDIFGLNDSLKQNRFGGGYNSVHNTTHVK